MENKQSKIVFGDYFILIQEYPQFFEHGDLNHLLELYKYPQDLLRLPYLFKDYRHTKLISKNKNVDINVVKSQPSIWEYNWLTINSSIKANDIFDNPILPWDMSVIMCNPNIDLTYVLENPDIE